MTFDPRFVIDVIYPADNSAYMIMTVPDPPLGAGYALVGAIEADPRRAAAAMAVADPKQHRMVSRMLSESKIFGLVAWNEAAKTALVAFRGTVTIWDWIDDLDAIPVDYLAVPGSGHVHMGFQLVYEHVRDSVSGLLASGCKGAQRILVTGTAWGAPSPSCPASTSGRPPASSPSCTRWPDRGRARPTSRETSTSSSPSAIAS